MLPTQNAAASGNPIGYVGESDTRQARSGIVACPTYTNVMAIATMIDRASGSFRSISASHAISA
ncbi:hypothetical protein PC116_g33528 [Phytophthora cactorum]|nr:hypothetical protein PC116_g33528 [Phytophthora cactorum]